jgi:hypothetical protein
VACLLYSILIAVQILNLKFDDSDIIITIFIHITLHSAAQGHTISANACLSDDGFNIREGHE